MLGLVYVFNWVLLFIIILLFTRCRLTPRAKNVRKLRAPVLRSQYIVWQTQKMDSAPSPRIQVCLCSNEDCNQQSSQTYCNQRFPVPLGLSDCSAKCVADCWDVYWPYCKGENRHTPLTIDPLNRDCAMCFEV